MCRGPNNHTPAQKKKRREQTHCAFCGRQLHPNSTHAKGTIDHFYPVVAGEGLNRGWNKLIVCHDCNQDKGNLMPDEYILKLQKEVAQLEKMINNISRYRDELEGWFIMKEII